jgi:hypothetical protein
MDYWADRANKTLHLKMLGTKISQNNSNNNNRTTNLQELLY